jgi:hypothetical protein
MVWMLIAIPMTAVLLGITMIILAVTTWDGLVIDDYYTYGKEINRVLVRDRYAAERGIHGRLNWAVEDGRLDLAISSSQPLPPASEITLDFLHPTRSGMDERVSLARGPEGRYHGVTTARLPEGDWIIQLGTDTWRLNARTRIGSGPVAVEFGPVEDG